MWAPGRAWIHVPVCPTDSQLAAVLDTSKSLTMKIDRRGFLVASSSALLLSEAKLSLEENERPSDAPEPAEVDPKIQGREIAV